MENEKLLCRIGYKSYCDAYALSLSSDGGKTWNVETLSFCQCGKHDTEDDEPMYVHVQLIEALKRAIANGYTMVY